MVRRAAACRLLFVIPSVVFSAGLVGCGSGMSAGDMKQYAIRRPSNEEQTLPAANVNARSTPASTNSTPPPLQPVEAPPVAVPTTVAADGSSDANSAPLQTAASPETAAPPVTETAEVAQSAGATSKLSDTDAPPPVPLDPEARARRTVENLTRIGQAFEAYARDRGLYPTRATFAAGDQKPLLSWRVALLPYLGYKELHAAFRLDEPWNSRHNHELLAQIPAVYQSPERFDEQTNYLVPVGGSSVFSGRRGIAPRHIEDGARNTVLAIEVDDALAVPWTEPREYDVDLRAPTKSLGSLRKGSLFVVWGGGEVGRVSMSSPQESLRAMFTADAGENFVAGSIDQPLFPSGAEHRNSSQFVEPTVVAMSDVPSSTHVASGAAPTVSTGGAADAALAALAAEYTQRAAETQALGNEREAIQWFYAAAVVSPAGGDWVNRYQWVPALRRPTPRLRFGVGLNYSGPREKAVQQANINGVARGSSRAAKGTGPWSMITGAIGEQIVSVLRSHSEKSGGEMLTAEPVQAPGQRLPRAARPSILETSHGAPLAPGVYFLAAAREAVLLQAAQREGVDVLVVVDWRDAGHNWSVRLTLIDVARRETLLSLPRVTSAALEQARTNPLAENPLASMMRELTEYVEGNLVMQSLPQQIKPRHVARRLDALAADAEENPLRNLAEMRYYGELGLADPTQLLLAYQSLIGTKEGSELVLGDAEARKRLLKQWLPLATADQGALTARRTAADD